MLQKLHTKKSGFTLVEIMIVVAIIALLAAIAVPSFLRARLRSQATTVLNELRLVDAAKDQYMIETNEAEVDPFTGNSLQPYVKADSALYNALNTAGETIDRLDGDVVITFNAGDELPSVTVPQAMLDVASQDDFWSPYTAETP